MPSPQSPNTFRLDARHPQEVLEICEVGGELRELRVEVVLFRVSLRFFLVVMNVYRDAEVGDGK